MVAQPVIEKIALLIYAISSSHELLPVHHGCFHSRFARERDNGVQMIGHKQVQAAMPDEFFAIELHSGEHIVASACAAQLVFARRHAIDGDKEPTAVGHPFWNSVRQLLANRQCHARSVARRSHGANAKRSGAQSSARRLGFPKFGTHGVTRPTERRSIQLRTAPESVSAFLQFYSAKTFDR